MSELLLDVLLVRYLTCLSGSVRLIAVILSNIAVKASKAMGKLSSKFLEMGSDRCLYLSGHGSAPPLAL